MRIVVRWFAALREARGTELESVELPEGSSASEAYARLSPLPGLPVAFAINEAMASGSTPLADGDEVAFLPPLGGG